jgi:hypothetical protein
MTDPSTPSTAAIYTAAPLLTIDGQSHELLSANLTALEIHESITGLSRCEALFNNTGIDADGNTALPFDASDSPLVFGKVLRVGSGEAGTPIEIFMGRISGLEALYEDSQVPQLRVLAEDGLLAARLARRSHSYQAGTLADLIRAIAQNAGLTPQITGCDQAIGIQVQLDESDLAFLRRVLARYDVNGQVVGDELQVAPRNQVRRNELTIDYPGSIRRVRILADLAHQVTDVTWSGWDIAQGQALTATSNTVDLGPGTSGYTGKEIYEHAFGQRHEHMGAWSCANQDEAQALVDAAHSARARRFMAIHGECSGNPALRVGTHLTLTGLGPRFSCVSYVTSVCHRFNLQDGYRCTFIAESSRFGGGDG